MTKIDLTKIACDINEEISKDVKSVSSKDFYKKSKVFTEHFFEKAVSILESNGMESYGFKEYRKNKHYFQREKLSIDLVVWESKYNKFDRSKAASEEENVEYAGYIWKYLVLIEHENDGEDWLHELQKLCMTSAPYKLIITYGRRKEKKEKIPATKTGKGVQLLEYANKIVEFSGNNTFQEFVIMFGEESSNLDKLQDNEGIYDIYRYSKEKSIFEKFEY
ncbi:MAG: hypothetical protein CVU85_07615 [Firmicutes bacterium HGW-Firmicutes-10]|jgi:hypothetical protein|nr:MAG: hypothetical protein CVU85_07615 [Firmicutes bacterium HGW-Firmicutes-10]